MVSAQGEEMKERMYAEMREAIVKHSLAQSQYYQDPNPARQAAKNEHLAKIIAIVQNPAFDPLHPLTMVDPRH